MSERLAILGGSPVRSQMLPYVRHEILSEDIEAVVASLKSGWLTTGPGVRAFEAAFEKKFDNHFACAVSSGTAALHLALECLDLEKSSEVLVPAITFIASANAILYAGLTPVFVDVDPQTLLMDLNDLEQKISPKSKAVISVDYAGQSLDYTNLKKICKDNSLTLIADACHSLGAFYNNEPVGTLADLTAFSFHAAKSVACGEGGLLLTKNVSWAKKIKTLRHHGINVDHHDRLKLSQWTFDQECLGYNYRLTDMQCALGLSQLRRLDDNVKRRKQICQTYDAFFKSKTWPIVPLKQFHASAHHLYTIVLDHLKIHRDQIFEAFRKENIGVIVTYAPVYNMTYYQNRFPSKNHACPQADSVSKKILNLPLFASMTENDVQDVLHASNKIFDHFFA